MKIHHLNQSDISGGAARAAYRIHRSLIENGVESKMLVDTKLSDDSTVIQGNRSLLYKAKSIFRHKIAQQFRKRLQTGNAILHSPAIVPSGRVKELNSLDTDMLHLHWVGSEMLSISDIGRLKKSLVWTLHDMWAFCGAEHYTDDFRWREGYSKDNRPGYESGFDLNRYTWLRKKKQWQRSIHIVTPSQWLANCVRQSKLMGDWPVTVIPNPIDIEKWQQIGKTQARHLLQLKKDIPLLIFGAIGGSSDPRKGFDLLQTALQYLKDKLPDLELLIFGQTKPHNPPNLGFRTHYLGHLHDDLSLRIAYSATDAMIIPSRQDNLPNTGVEALACGTPVVAFDACGLPDIVQHKETGYLAQAFDSQDLANGIEWVLSDKERYGLLCDQARKYAEQRFNQKTVVNQYRAVYEEVLAQPNLRPT
ncbi:MAG: glycosyltransferase family 4 protein [Leptonema sp. (in: Bacteria)]|nr:glycosyltransferase family 4 protein [Leptonema sp. (in: bacteria)]